MRWREDAKCRVIGGLKPTLRRLRRPGDSQAARVLLWLRQFLSGRVIIMKIRKFTAAAVLLWAGFAWAQPMTQEMAQGIYDKQVRDRRAAQQQNSGGGGSRGPSAAEIRAWHEREARIQAEIAQERATPYWMAIAYDFNARRALWAGGYYTEKRAVEEALKQCVSSNCQVFATFANACGVVTRPDRGVHSIQDFFLGVNTDDYKAAANAMQACEAKHGKDNCSYWSMQTKHGTAFCTGYDYSVYGQE